MIVVRLPRSRVYTATCNISKNVRENISTTWATKAFHKHKVDCIFLRMKFIYFIVRLHYTTCLHIIEQVFREYHIFPSPRQLCI